MIHRHRAWRQADGPAFDRNADDEEVLRSDFQALDRNGQQHITMDAIDFAAGSDPDRAVFWDVLKGLLKDSQRIDFQAFKEAADRIPRARGQRVDWASRLGLDGALARYLPVGDILDQLKGVKCMSDDALQAACRRFAERDLFRLVKAGRDSLRAASRAVQESGSNLKFSESGPAVTAKYAGLDEFLEGPEGLLGQPNPKLEEGMRREHCLRTSASAKVVTPNYGVCTTSCWEWHWMVDAEAEKLPEDLKQWLAAHMGLYPGQIGEQVLERTVRFALPRNGLVDAKLQSTVDELQKQLGMLKETVLEGNQVQELHVSEALARGVSVISPPAANLATDRMEGEVALPAVWFTVPDAEDRLRTIIATAAGAADPDTVTLTISPRVYRYCRFTETKFLREQLRFMPSNDIEEFLQECTVDRSSATDRLRNSLESLKSAAASDTRTTVIDEACAAFDSQTADWKSRGVFRRQGRLRPPKLELFFERLCSKHRELLGRAKLQILEVLALGLYTGPLYVLYNAVLRGFPQHITALLDGNR